LACLSTKDRGNQKTHNKPALLTYYNWLISVVAMMIMKRKMRVTIPTLMNVFSNESNVFSGVMAKSIEIACNEFEKKLNVKWENYIVTIGEVDVCHIINFSPKAVSPGFRGASDGVPGFEIKIKKSNYEIIESQFVR